MNSLGLINERRTFRGECEMRSKVVDKFCQLDPVEKCLFGSTSFPLCDLFIRSLGQKSLIHIHRLCFVHYECCFVSVRN